jgi:hypothetical protein
MQSELLGTWSLVSFELEMPDGTVHHPYGEAVEGYLVYSNEGIMSAAFMSSERAAGGEQDLAAEGTTGNYDAFMAYSGPFRIEGDRVAHDVEVSSMGAWTGTVQERWFKIDGDVLSLLTAPLSVGDEAPVGRLVWNRVKGKPSGQ